MENIQYMSGYNTVAEELAKVGLLHNFGTYTGILSHLNKQGIFIGKKVQYN